MNFLSKIEEKGEKIERWFKTKERLLSLVVFAGAVDWKEIWTVISRVFLLYIVNQAFKTIKKKIHQSK